MDHERSIKSGVLENRQNFKQWKKYAYGVKVKCPYKCLSNKFKRLVDQAGLDKMEGVPRKILEVKYQILI